MKIALCYHGIAKGKNFKSGGLDVGYRNEFDLIQRNLIWSNPDHDFDVFMHSWSKEFEQEVVDYMQPLKFDFEEPKELRKAPLLLLIKELIKKALGKDYEFKRLNNIYSRWYSFKRSIDLIAESGNEYDLIIATRFDMSLLSPFLLNNISPSKFYSGDWIGAFYEDRLLEGYEYGDFKLNPKTVLNPIGYPYDDRGLQDFFFISGTEYMMTKFSKIFDYLDRLIPKYGKSNHFIALGQLKETGMEKNHSRILKYGEDYFLSRWL
ncbi:hypothetical protein [Lentiprolixibacter aurantiacus]|uniref:Glycosyltransferase n=1 Tax=Lentiprolixibacter aurantiacus TaxID=2993939 RepID=A0AAE3SMK6_9FLAO|nr:hypothetical protein [Lentiprolixibacter aurantiacus]MCX2718545.1 hypothetical protein [Lentiprolixibacter aurantiacus]